MVLLGQGEKMLREGRASLEEYKKVLSENDESRTVEKSAGGSGTLYLTNQRIIFEKAGGFLSKKTEIILTSGLGNIMDVHLEGMFGKKLAIQFRDLEKRKFGVDTPEEWEKAVKSAIQG